MTRGHAQNQRLADHLETLLVGSLRCYHCRVGEHEFCWGICGCNVCCADDKDDPVEQLPRPRLVQPDRR